MADPDILDTWATSSLTPQIAAAGRTTTTCSTRLPDGPVPPGARHHPHLAVLAGRPGAPRARRAPWTHATMSGSWSTPTARSRASPRATAVPDDVLDRFGADAVRWRAAGARPGLDSPFDEAQMKVGRRRRSRCSTPASSCSPPRRIRARRRRVRPRRRPSSPKHRPGECSPRLRGVVDRGRRPSRLRLRHRPGGLREVLLGLLRRLSRAGQGALAPRRLPGVDRQERIRAGPVGPAAAAGAVPAVRDRGSLVLVAGGLDPPRRVAGQRRRPDTAATIRHS